MNKEMRDFAVEEWRPVWGTDAYEVSSFGRVRSLERVVRAGNHFRTVRARILKTSIANGYAVCSAHRHVTVHRLVAESFVDGWAEGLQVNHKDGDRANNVPSNLEWVTASENNRHSFRVLGRVNPATGRKGGDHWSSKPVESVDTMTGKVVAYQSIQDVARDGFNPNIVSKCLRGRRGYRSHKGCTWRYANAG